MTALATIINIALVWTGVMFVIVLLWNALLGFGRAVSSRAISRRMAAMEAGAAEVRFVEVPYHDGERRIFLYTGWDGNPEMFRLELEYFLAVRDVRLLGTGHSSAGPIISVTDPPPPAPTDDPQIVILSDWHARKRREGGSVSQ